MSFRSEEVMVGLLLQGQGDDDDNQECNNSTRAGGDTGGTKNALADLALLRARLRQALEIRV